MSFNPFDLLGVTIDSTPDEARASFRELALLAHPDKGGRPDDMRALLSAYRYVLGQLEAVNRTTTVEDLEARFAAFCAAQTDEDLDLRDPALRALVRGQEGTRSADGGSGSGFDADVFNAHFERTKAAEDARAAEEATRGSDVDVPTSKETSDDMSALEAMFRGPMGGDGYGASMAPSEYSAPQNTTQPLERRPLEPPAYRPIGTPAPPNLPQRASTSSSSFAALPSSSSHGASSTAVALWSSLSARKGGAGGTDYVDAFGAAAEVAEVVARYADEWESGSIEERLEAYKTQCGVGY